MIDSDRSDAAGSGEGRGRTRPFLRLAQGVIDLLEWSGKLIAAGTLSVLFVALLTNVILRYGAGKGIPWAYEIHAILLPWLVAGGIVIATARSRNIAITLLPELAGARVRRAFMLFVEAAIIVISISVLWSSQPILRASTFQTLSTLGVKAIWGYSSMVYSFGAMAIIAALDIVLLLGGKSVMDDDPAHASLS
ncbi:TRAP transporter small permease [Thioclava sp. JE_KL1]|uniref:TRAP transporter small permease n=1 Tax=Thioclava sp. JE_KL1 TaxID=2651187 RepID=UPI00128E672C|nr:TRAP transporter small permease subunit [Thioclava sp. JE_KL1]MPQ95562.1 TRAP transporter small permease subunit [Thioclava sp. JE_KL1]